MSKPSSLKEILDRDLQNLAQARDELRVQLQLAKDDARDDWRLLEDTWLRVQSEVQRLRDHAKEPANDIADATRKLVDELKRGYDNIKAQLKDAASHAR